MKIQKLIIVNGLPASGKTSLAEELSRELHIPMFNKDGVKEVLSDSMRVVSVQGSRRFNDPSWALLFYISKTLLTHKFSVIIEGNFKPSPDMEEFGLQLKNSGVTIIEIFCKVPGEILVDRFTKRLDGRHPIHPRVIPLSFVRELRASKLTPLNIGKTLEIDTSDFSKIPYRKIIKFIRK